MKTLILLLLIILTGCNNLEWGHNISQYTRDHPGVSCEPVNYRCENVSTFKDGKLSGGDCHAIYLCSDGVKIERIN